MRRSRTIGVQWCPEILGFVAGIGGQKAWFQERIIAFMSIGFEVWMLRVIMLRRWE
jgi:hypothetical protein